jgi:alpha-mannosidase
VSRRLTFHLIPHTHWDREWYLPRAAFQARLVPLLDNLLDQLGRDPSARFLLDGQTILLEDFLAVRPERRADVERAARRGSLETGPWYILADELIPSGESLVRNLLEGARQAAALGARLDLLYSPDAFGHPAMLPSLASEFGLTTAAVWRGVGRPAGEDRDLYHWIAPDGQSVLLYHLPADGYSIGAELATRTGDDLARLWAAVRRDLVARAASDHVAVWVGADHHAPASDLSVIVERLQALEPEHAVQLSGVAEFIAAVRQAAPGPLHPVKGELRRIEGHTWVLQGVHGTRSRLKRQHAQAELTLTRAVEPLVAVVGAANGLDQRPLLRHTWRALLQCQFHDTLGGTAVDDVAREQEGRLASVSAGSRELAAPVWHAITGHDADRARATPAATTPALFLWNPCPRPRGGIVTAELTFFRGDVLVGPPAGRVARTGPGIRPFVLQTPDGARIPVQLLAVRAGQERLDAERYYPDQDEVDRAFVAFEAPDCEGLGLIRADPVPSGRVPRAAGLEARGGKLRNRFVTVEVSDTGSMTLEDRRSGERYPGLSLLEDEPDAGDSYTFSRGRGRSARGGTPGLQRVVAAGPLVGAVETRWSLAAGSSGDIDCRLLVVLYADSPLVRLRYDIDNQATDHRLRARFSVGAGEEAIAGAAFTAMSRPPVTPEPEPGALERPVRTAPAHRFVAAAEDSRGLALLAPGFFEYEWTADQDLAITLIRSIGELSRSELRERPGHAGWPEAIPLAQEPGAHVIQLALAPVNDEVLRRPDRLEGMWEDAFLPLHPTFYRMYSGPANPPAMPRGRLQGNGLVVTAIKPPESGAGIIVRCCNLTGEPTAGRWISSAPLRGAWLVRADETEIEELTLEDDGSVRFAVPAGAIRTIRLAIT